MMAGEFDITKGRMRILQRDQKKLAMRLEDIFWAQLKEFAADDKMSLAKFVFSILDQAPAKVNRTAFVRCYCLDRWRKKASHYQLAQIGFDVVSVIAACPSPIVIITPERKIAAYNPAFSTQILRKTDSDIRDSNRAIQLSLNQPLSKIQAQLIDEPQRILIYHVGFRSQNHTSYHRARFALINRALGCGSHMILFLEPQLEKA